MSAGCGMDNGTPRTRLGEALYSLGPSQHRLQIAQQLRAQTPALGLYDLQSIGSREEPALATQSPGSCMW